MKIALISPKGATCQNEEFMNFYNTCKELMDFRRRFTGFSSGLLVISSLTPESFETKLINENFEPIDFNENYDLVGITGLTQQITRAYQIADKFRAKFIGKNESSRRKERKYRIYMPY